jgi:pilus assembly protein CpaD
MKSPITKRNATVSPRRAVVATNAVLVSVAALTVIGCTQTNEAARLAGSSIVDPTQRHPVLVSQQPSNLAIRVRRGSQNLSPHQRAQVIDFLDRYRARNTGDSKLVILAPRGAANEVAAMQAVVEIRHLMREAGFDEATIAVETYHEPRDSQPPIRVSYLHYVAEGPECGHWPSNLAEEPKNLAHPNLGCATQRNFAAMVSNPADLLGPRHNSGRPGERRDQVWEKYVKGESTIARKQADEKVQVKGAN